MPGASVVAMTSMLSKFSLLALAGSLVQAAPVAQSSDESSSASSSSSSNLFPTNIAYLGPTSTGIAPFLAQTNEAAAKTGTPTATYILPQPIETSIQALDHVSGDRNIFECFGSISPYYVSTESWGIYEYGLPDQCTIEQVHILSRHGTRYSDSTSTLRDSLANATGSGNLTFINDWISEDNQLGLSILTTLGNQQLFDKGARTYFRYGGLFNFTDGSRLLARSTSQERMTMSAEYFLLGFFGTNWQDYADLELVIENEDFNNTLAAYYDCPNYDTYEDSGVISETSADYLESYLANATERIQSQLSGINVTTALVFAMQQQCSYEANNLGFSHFCGIFTQQEWENYEYYLSWNWYDDSEFGSPTSRGMGIGWVEEFRERLESKTYSSEYQSEQNSTLDNSTTYFPVGNDLYADFTHDDIITNIYSALNFQQFKSNFSSNATNPQPFDLSRVVPFGSQTYIEVIECDEEVPADRSALAVNGTSTTKYIHFILNDHTLPLHANVPEYCPERADGWCEFNNFTTYLDTLWSGAEYEKSCYGDIANATVTDGVPETK